MNMEKISIDIAKIHLENMVDDMQDISCPEYLDERKIVNNIQNGFIILTNLITFFESLLNTIISNCMLCNSEIILKMSIEEKIEIICMHYKVDKQRIKGIHGWEVFKSINKIRNTLVHYKESYICESMGLQDFKIENISVKSYFVKSNFEQLIMQIEKYATNISEILGLKIKSDVKAIECDGKDGFIHYIYDEVEPLS